MSPNKYDKMYMDIALRASKESKCPRKQVGCCVLLESGMIAIGFNGHASGGPNEWAYEELGNPEVVHAELNALGKLLEQGVSAKGATVYVTYSPCIECAKLLVRSKVKRVVYLEAYRKTEGIDYLAKYGVQVEKYSEHSQCFPCVVTVVWDDRTEVYEFDHCVSKGAYTPADVSISISGVSIEPDFFEVKTMRDYL